MCASNRFRCQKAAVNVTTPPGPRNGVTGTLRNGPGREGRNGVTGSLRNGFGGQARNGVTAQRRNG